MRKRRKRPETLTWALLAPVGPERLEALAREYQRAVAASYPGGAREAERQRGLGGWEIVSGSGDYSALLERDPGAEDTAEGPLAKLISRKTKGRVYVLYFTEDFAGTDLAVEVYEGGRLKGGESSPYVVARALGLVLPGDEKGGPAPPKSGRVTGLVVVCGASAAEVGRVFGLHRGRRLDPLRIEEVPRGTLLYDEQSGDSTPYARRVSAELPERDVYVVTAEPDEGHFIAQLLRAGRKVGSPDSVEGEADAIARALINKD